MRARLLALILVMGCGAHGGGGWLGDESMAARGTGDELVLPPELGEAARLRSVILRQPIIGKIDQGPTPVVIRGKVPRREARRLVELARAIHADVNARFVEPRLVPHPPVDLVLYTDDEEYQALATGYARVPAGQGFYRPDARVAAVNLARGRGNLRHELVHPLIVDDFPGIPTWLNEGIASMYGGAHRVRGRFQFVANDRLRDLTAAIEDGLLPTRHELAFAGRPELYGADGAIYYAVSQHVVLYLERRGRLEAYYRTVRTNPSLRGAALAAEVDWRRFVRWAKRLRDGARPPQP